MYVIENARIIPNALDGAMRGVRHIYQCAFPESERKPIEVFDRMIVRSDYRFVVIEQEGETIGFAILFTPRDLRDAALLEYLAVDSAHQGRGAGMTLVQFVIKLAGARPLLVEVESFGELQGQRRREFYRRAGFRTVRGLEYVVPLANSPGMELMVVNAATDLDGDTLGRWIKLIYREVYLCDEGDLRLRKMLGALSAPVLLD